MRVTPDRLKLRACSIAIPTMELDVYLRIDDDRPDDEAIVAVLYPQPDLYDVDDVAVAMKHMPRIVQLADDVVSQVEASAAGRALPEQLAELRRIIDRVQGKKPIEGDPK